MLNINAFSVNEALVVGLRTVRRNGTPEPSRNGSVLVMDQPVTTTYHQPRQRVLTWGWRDANPFFHLYEALWMLDGANDVASVSQFVARMADFSDDGKTFNGAYGYRWRKYFCVDQLRTVVENLCRNIDCRRQVITMSDPLDLTRVSNDIPCNIAASVRIQDNQLDLYVFNRSNDLIWGAYGANAVHFSLLQEYLAGLVGVDVGIYEQISCNWHAYTDVLSKYPPDEDIGQVACPYQDERISVSPQLVPPGMDQTTLDHYIHKFVGCEPGSNKDYSEVPFLEDVARPLMDCWLTYKQETGERRFLAAQDCLKQSGSRVDWIVAASEWIERRHLKWIAKQ